MLQPPEQQMYLRALKDRQGLRSSSVSRRGRLGRPLVDVIELDQHGYSRVEPEQSLLQGRDQGTTKLQQYRVAAGCIRTTGRGEYQPFLHDAV